MTKISRNTRQKEIIENESKKMNSFFTGEDLIRKVNKVDKKIGIATIYRFLKDQRKNNRLHTFNCKNKAIYSNQNKNHSHFICEKCKNTQHLEIKDIDFIKKELKKDICHFQLDIYGICDKCKSN